MLYWLSPLPPSGPILRHVGWPEMGAPEKSVAVEAAELIEVARRARRLW